VLSLAKRSLRDNPIEAYYQKKGSCKGDMAKLFFVVADNLTRSSCKVFPEGVFCIIIQEKILNCTITAFKS